jgi:hypothetical protein
MEVPTEIRERPDVSAEEHATRETIKRILKLRWMGMEEEAEKMQKALRRVELDVILLKKPCHRD